MGPAGLPAGAVDYLLRLRRPACPVRAVKHVNVAREAVGLPLDRQPAGVVAPAPGLRNIRAAAMSKYAGAPHVLDHVLCILPVRRSPVVVDSTVLDRVPVEMVIRQRAVPAVGGAVYEPAVRQKLGEADGVEVRCVFTKSCVFTRV